MANLYAAKLALRLFLMTNTVWITRTLPSAQESVLAWQAAGFKAIAQPLLEIAKAPAAPKPPSPESMLVFTSKNGVFAFQGYGFAPQNKVITVGDATARAARLAGFKNVISAQGMSDDVTALIRETISLNTPIIHCGGRHLRGAIVEDLQAAGYAARRDLYYQTTPVKTWPDIDYSALSHIAFYSPLAAQTFYHLMKQDMAGNASLDIHALSFMSISLAVDAALEDLTPAQRLIAQAPNEASMLAHFNLTHSGLFKP